MTDNKIDLSVIMISYNHGKFIAEAVKNILSQNFNGHIEIIIADDCSTDNTTNIIQEIIASNNSSINIKYTHHKINKGMVENLYWAFNQAKGKYIAICEGDDFWINTNKLQHQIDFLEKNLSYSFCCHKTLKLENNQLKQQSFKENIDHFKGKDYFDFDLNTYGQELYIPTASLVFRSSLIDIDNFKKYKLFRDTQLKYNLLKHGPARYFNEEWSVYRIHENGVFSGLERYEKYKIAFLVNQDIYTIDNDPNFFQLMKVYSNFMIKYQIYNEKKTIFNASLLSNIIKDFKHFKSPIRSLKYIVNSIVKS